MTQKFKTIQDVQDAIDRGEKVYWSNKSYQVTEQVDVDGKKRLRVTCLSNWFGSYLEHRELADLFTDGDEK